MGRRIYAYNFRFKKAAFAIILLIMTMPTQVSALGFLQLKEKPFWISKWVRVELMTST